MPNKPNRPKVGEADPATRRKMLDETFARERADGEASASKARQKRMAERKKPKPEGTTLGGLLDPKRERDRTVEGEDKTIMDAVNRGVDMGTPKRRK